MYLLLQLVALMHSKVDIIVFLIAASPHVILLEIKLENKIWTFLKKSHYFESSNANPLWTTVSTDIHTIQDPPSHPQSKNLWHRDSCHHY